MGSLMGLQELDLSFESFGYGLMALPELVADVQPEHVRQHARWRCLCVLHSLLYIDLQSTCFCHA